MRTRAEAVVEVRRPFPTLRRPFARIVAGSYAGLAFALEDDALKRVGQRVIVEFNPDDQFATVIAGTERFLRALRAFADAAAELNEAWEDHPSHVLHSEGYPFADSFDEVAANIREWTRKAGGQS